MTPATARIARRDAGFTFVEVLVAMVFMAVVIPVAVEGILMANKAGVVAERKRIAAQLADTKLTEMVLTEDWRYGTSDGDFDEDYPDYTWSVSDNAWDEEGLLELTVVVSYMAQGKTYEVRLSTLVPEEEAADETMAFEVE